MRRAVIVATAVPTGIVLLLGAEVLLAINGPSLEPAEPFELSGPIGISSQEEALAMVWIGDSVTAGVGASGPDATVPRLVAHALDRQVLLDVFATSGARVAGAIAEQVPQLEALPDAPDVVVVQIGGNDVIHLTGIDEFDETYARLLDRVTAVGAEHVLALGIPAFGATPRFLQPLRAIVGWRGERLDERIREAAAERGVTYVDVSGNTSEEFGDDPHRYHAADDFHPSDDGYILWADAVLKALDKLGIS
jgi:lysophospholipase L1-like esterase